jgi:hypothetical protein
MKSLFKNHSSIKALMLGSLGLLLSACSGGNGTFMKNLDLRVSAQGNESFVTLSSQFELGNVSLDAATYTIKDPKTQQQVGKIDFGQTTGGMGAITMEVNASLLVHADPDLGLTLPNGRPLPLALSIERGDSFGVPVNEHSRVYLGGSLQTTIFAGVAIAIKGLDQVMDQLSNPANVFYNFRPNDKIMGAGGIYGSPVAHQNGVAIFGAYSKNGGMFEIDFNEFDNNDFNRLDSKTQGKIIDFFYGEPRKLEVL